MFKGIRYVKKKLRTRIHVNRILTRYKNNSSVEKYHFTETDISLYIAECLTNLPQVEVVESGEKHSLLRVGEVELYWPNDIPHQDIPWLYHEVFDSWESNPSSYAHPKLKHVNQLDWVIDAGASEGFYSLFVRQSGFQGRLLAVEPLSVLQDSLMMSINNNKGNKGEGEFEVVNKALGSEVGSVDISIDSKHLCSSEIKTAPSDNASHFEKVEITTIDRLVLQHYLKGKGIIKMDIEGYEMDALKGAEKTIKELKPQIAVAVYHDYANARKCADILKSFRQDYNIEFRGMYGYFEPPRPYMMFAY